MDETQRTQEAMIKAEEDRKFKTILDAIVGAAQGTKRLEIVKTYERDGSNSITVERTTYRIVDVK